MTAAGAQGGVSRVINWKERCSLGKLIAVIGNTAAGKTTLVAALATAAPFATGLEGHAERPFQYAFAANPRYALANQIDYLLLRAEQEHAIRSQPRVGLVDGGLDEDYFVFTRHFYEIGYLDRAEYALCTRFYQFVRSVQPPPDLYLYLQTPLDLLYERFLHRDRDIEIATVDHLAQLQRQVDDWVLAIEPTRLIVLDGRTDAMQHARDLAAQLQQLADGASATA